MEIVVGQFKKWPDTYKWKNLNFNIGLYKYSIKAIAYGCTVGKALFDSQTCKMKRSILKWYIK